jgi:predicted Zn-dependent protease
LNEVNLLSKAGAHAPAFSFALKLVAALSGTGLYSCCGEVMRAGTHFKPQVSWRNINVPSTRTLCVAGMLTFSCLAIAQGRATGGHPGNPTPPPPKPQTSTFDERQVQLESKAPKKSAPGERDDCFLPPLTGIQLPTVGVGALQISSKAKKDYASGCNAFKDGKFDSAEENFRKAVNDEPKYLAAWITLGQLLAARQKFEDARAACSNAQSADPMYLPSYLCLADIAARSEHWDDVLKFSARALEIDAANDPVAYDYNAAANLNLHKLLDAEKSALKAIEIDRAHSDPRVHFLLAQIYEAEGEHEKEATQLREYLKYAGPSDAAMVKQYLSELEKQQK